MGLASSKLTVCEVEDHHLLLVCKSSINGAMFHSYITLSLRVSLGAWSKQSVMGWHWSQWVSMASSPCWFIHQFYSSWLLWMFICPCGWSHSFDISNPLSIHRVGWRKNKLLETMFFTWYHQLWCVSSKSFLNEPLSKDCSSWISYFIGGLEHFLFFHECHHPNWLSFFSEG